MGRYFAIVLAAGSGQRFGHNIPKQYQLIHDHPLLWHTLAVFFRTPEIDKVVVIIASHDSHFSSFTWPKDKELIVLKVGGTSRLDSVRHGIQALQSQEVIGSQDWLLTHDAARCCIQPTHISQFIHQLQDNPVGGLMAIPVCDTVKQASENGCSIKTINRDGLWLAQTPQMFRAELLKTAINQKGLFTDEANAVESLGYQPKLIEGLRENIKITYPHDFVFANTYLASIQPKDMPRNLSV